jgi:hypothetical protein
VYDRRAGRLDSSNHHRCIASLLWHTTQVSGGTTAPDVQSIRQSDKTLFPPGLNQRLALPRAQAGSSGSTIMQKHNSRDHNPQIGVLQ